MENLRENLFPVSVCAVTCPTSISCLWVHMAFFPVFLFPNLSLLSLEVTAHLNPIQPHLNSIIFAEAISKSGHIHRQGMGRVCAYFLGCTFQSITQDKPDPEYKVEEKRKRVYCWTIDQIREIPFALRKARKELQVETTRSCPSLLPTLESAVANYRTIGRICT